MKLLNRTMLVLLFAIVTMGWAAHDSLAAEKELIPTTSPKVILTDYSGDKLENIHYDITPFATQHIRSGTTFMQLLTASTVRVNETTDAYIPVNTIKVILYLQQWNSSLGKWVDVVEIGPSVKYNSNSISYTKQVQTVRGYSYRLKAQHTTVHNGVTEQLTSISNQLYIP